MQVIARHDLDENALEQRLYEFNSRAIGRDDGRSLGFVVEAGGETVAGAAGYTWAGIGEVAQLWVREDQRGLGLGSALMAAAIAECRARDCRFVFVASHSFQAPAFYERLGFDTIAIIPDKPLGYAEHILRLALD